MMLEEQTRTLTLDEHGRATLDGPWQFFPGNHGLADLDSLSPVPIDVPGLWEAQGHLELDGIAWYRLRFSIDNPTGWWTLRFAAVMDTAEAYLNGRLLGSHEQPFTPFELLAGAALVAGVNVLDVRVSDPSIDDPEHIRSAHGKQGWANHVFPSPPSLYLTYGGIWQPVTLRRHGRVVVRNPFLTSDPDNLDATVDVVNLSDEPAQATVGLRTLGLVCTDRIALTAGETRTLTWNLGQTTAPRWNPGDPVLHDALIDVEVDGHVADRSRVRFGLRTVRIDGTRLLINDVPYKMKSVLVQGFRAEELYAEASRESIEEEVRAARDMGFTMLRLHIKGFDPTYLDVCDELGMLVHSDLPVAEPIAHEEMGDRTELSRRCVETVGEQVRRDRNHPCIVLWSAMNEIGLDRDGVRGWEVYEEFVRTLYGAVLTADPTRPVIENDWVEPDPDRVFCSPILTAHWYGRLHSDYLDTLERQAQAARDLGRPLFVTELGDWGLPEMPELDDAPFWDVRSEYAAALVESLWPSTVGRFVRETQRYQGLSDRLQIEVLRRHNHIGGCCLTELTDVPHEFNGLLDLHRRPKPLAVAEIVRVNQVVLPVLHLATLVVVAGQALTAPLHVCNDGPALSDVEVSLRFVSTTAESIAVRELPGHAATQVGIASVVAPDVPGGHDLLLTLRAGGATLAENLYPVHVVARPSAGHDVQLLGDGPLADALHGIGARVGTAGPTVVAEGALDADLGAEIADRLRAGDAVIVLAQAIEAGPNYPVPVELAAVETGWGSTVFDFTTDSGALPSLPRRQLLVAEESTVQARNVIVRVAEGSFPEEPVVIAFKPVPGSITGTVVGQHRVGAGRLLLCQYRLASRAAAGDAAARALLADLVNWAADPRPPTIAERVTKDDGRALTYYSYAPQP